MAIRRTVHSDGHPRRQGCRRRPTCRTAQQWSCPGAAPPSCAPWPGPPHAPTVLLLHGWTASADLNWFTCYHPLVAPLPRGRARPSRPRPRHPLARRPSAWRTAPTTHSPCATCSASTRSSPSATRWVARSRSSIWRRHPERVRGLVLCATAPYFLTSREEKLGFLGLSGHGGARPAHAAAGPPVAHRAVLPAAQERRVGTVGHPGGLAARLADGAGGRSRDRQVQLPRVDRRHRRAHLGADHHARPGGAGAPPGAPVREHPEGRGVPGRRRPRLASVANPERFVPTLLRAVSSVVERSPRRSDAPSGRPHASR